MRYAIDYNKLINQFVPHYLGGRKLILYLQAIMHPLQLLNDSFREWARETRIEASMTSQIFKFEWYLNHKFAQYFLDPSQRIYIVNGEVSGKPIWGSGANVDGHFLLYTSKEHADDNLVLFKENEQTENSECSFTVHSPAINIDKISQQTYKTLLSSCINKYKLSTKSYTIILQNNEGV